MDSELERWIDRVSEHIGDAVTGYDFWNFRDEEEAHHLFYVMNMTPEEAATCILSDEGFGYFSFEEDQ